MIFLFLAALVALMHRLLLLDAEHIEHRGPTRIICPTCQRDVAPQVYHWHTRSHADE